MVRGEPRHRNAVDALRRRYEPQRQRRYRRSSVVQPRRARARRSSHHPDCRPARGRVSLGEATRGIRRNVQRRTPRRRILARSSARPRPPVHAAGGACGLAQRGGWRRPGRRPSQVPGLRPAAGPVPATAPSAERGPRAEAPTPAAGCGAVAQPKTPTKPPRIVRALLGGDQRPPITHDARTGSSSLEHRSSDSHPATEESSPRTVARRWWRDRYSDRPAGLPETAVVHAAGAKARRDEHGQHRCRDEEGEKPLLGHLCHLLSSLRT